MHDSSRMKRTLLLVMVLVGSSSFAQFTNTMTGAQFNNVYDANASFMRSQMQQNALFQSVVASARAERAAKAKAVAPKPKFPLSATDFKAVGPRNVPEQLAEGVTNPSERATAVKVYREVLAALEAEPSLRKNNFATSLGVLLGSSIEAVTGRELDAAQSATFIRDVNDALASDGAFKKVLDKDLAAASDTFLITGALIAALTEEGKGGDVARGKLGRELAEQVLTQFTAKK